MSLHASYDREGAGEIECERTVYPSGDKLPVYSKEENFWNMNIARKMTKKDARDFKEFQNNDRLNKHTDYVLDLFNSNQGSMETCIQFLKDDLEAEYQWQK